MMLHTLLANFALLTAFIYFGYMTRSRFLSKQQNTPWTRMLLGLMLGLFGVVLMYYNFPIGTQTVADFRQLPILIAVYAGGGISGGISTLIIAVYRLFFLHGFSSHSIVGAANVLITLLIALLFLRVRKLSLKRWMPALLLSAANTMVIFLLVLNINSWVEIITYTLLFIVAGLFTYSMLQHLREANESLKMMREAATRDYLTSLHNSRAFEAMMAQKITSSNRNGTPFTLLFVDIDFFKQVNDSYGHPAGDAILLQFADVLRDTFRPGDHIFRKGGEEFVILVDQCDAEQIEKIGERLRQNVASHLFRLPGGGEIKLTISAGSATYPNVHQEELISKADQALYEAKKTGRNRLCRAI
ncbi:diguanylate cyclase [Paenibacillus macerans]|uniref:GGDEF domain-containing protein n=1 Tax=Paenibacillus macerans TaxID=44252 RepID=UPI00203EA629|nr:diguanylate cyclase [Paenibacillus macerans]MCM3700057.1 diguanylate cyclase [Paenibacillus macerans]